MILSSTSVTLRTKVTCVAALAQPAVQHVEGDGAAQVADVGRGLHGRAADVDARPSGHERRRTAAPSGWRCRAGAGSRLEATGGARQDRATTSAVASAARPSPRPVRPRPSVVVALTETGAPTAALSAASASARRGPILGRLPTTCTATLPISKPAARTRRAVSASSAAPAAPAHCGSDGAEVAAEVAEARGRQQRVAGGVGRDVAVGVAGQPVGAVPAAGRRPSRAGPARTGARRCRCPCAGASRHGSGQQTAPPSQRGAAGRGRSCGGCRLRTRARRRAWPRPCPRWCPRRARARRRGSGGPWRACASRRPTGPAPCRGARGRGRPRRPC